MTTLKRLTRRQFLGHAAAGAVALGLPGASRALGQAGRAGRKTNVLFLAVDDLRPQLGCYGHAQMISPHIDALAAAGTRFDRAYCQVPVCGASRASLLTGLRPTPTRFVSFKSRADEDAPEARSLPDHFKAHGYRTASLGKIYHHTADHRDAWTEGVWNERPAGVANGRGYRSAENLKLLAAREQAGQRHAMPWEAEDVPDHAYPDGHIADEAIRRLQALKDEAFFLAVGFYKPHLPFNAPKRYWDLYQRDALDLADNPFAPKDAPRSALHNWGELRAYAGIPREGPVDEATARHLIHGYYACVSYTDAQVGRVMAELDRLGLRDNTVVILWGDHGWQLGEHGLWCKHSNFETSLHVPLIIDAPGIAGGQATRALCEFVDVYPTLCELTGLPQPEHLEGASAVPLLHRPERAWKAAAFSRYQQGDSIRTDRYRYTRFEARGDEPPSHMLYDHELDPMENVNLADTDAGRPIAQQLHAQLQAGWRAALPG